MSLSATNKRFKARGNFITFFIKFAQQLILLWCELPSITNMTVADQMLAFLYKGSDEKAPR